MLKAFIDVPLSIPPDAQVGAKLAYLEAWQYSNDLNFAADNVRLAPLEEAELHNWVLQRDRFTPPAALRNAAKLEGGIRLLFVHPRSTFTRTIPECLTQCSILQALHLPEVTFVSLTQAAGVFSTHTLPHGESVDSCSRLCVILKTPQKREITNGGLAISHDFESGITSGIVLGHGYAVDELTSVHTPKSLARFVEQINTCRANWCHPLLLPCLVLFDHVERVAAHLSGDISREVILVEHNVGVTKAGRSNQVELNFPDRPGVAAADQSLFRGEQMQRNQAKRLMKAINDLYTRILFVKRSPQWDNKAATFILEFLQKHARLSNYRGMSTGLMFEALEYVCNYSEACMDLASSAEARMQLQLNIVYTSIAQDDGLTSARLAASAGKDSTSMKILAVITAAYLPGTFVATLFSMNMFDWSAFAANGDNDVVSSFFWVYWSVAVPLTMLTLGGWALWWTFEKRRFDQEVQFAVQDKREMRAGRPDLSARLSKAFSR